jgi:hypothetical protein
LTIEEFRRFIEICFSSYLLRKGHRHVLSSGIQLISYTNSRSSFLLPTRSTPADSPFHNASRFLGVMAVS